ncbi:precorrin-8X methylmutase [Extibacter sp. GGCC_0201]|uniref:precorrin-8X methylmutase n=1 Tax=Extibacter sp. GGCC_0201 TaxID=2731209 RepID=UPI001AA14520|nr:precorrin-8X methylmutase [Extibacter sp. GGCC_0201]MBO1720126.1 precorrin-8X methylmutase [Extibacter sp. GGCC_0201]BDF33034.1 precorrin-8X methylmutase [Lachnospiraceae bacterium]
MMEHIGLEQVLPTEIEARSFEIITEELGSTPLVPGTEPIVKRCIHTSADFDYAHSLVFSDRVVERALAALRQGADIVTDTEMGRAGINKKRLAKYGGEVLCYMADEDVALAAERNGTTRAAASMDKAAALDKKVIFAVGNAPTALVRIYELVREGVLKPEAVIAVSVGFVNVVRAKELILELKETPSIVAKGRKGGSNIAACICNALLYMLEERGQQDG